jgi:hypothetical protein
MSKKHIGLSILIIALAALLTYLPAFKIQFYDGWWYLIWAATMDLPRYAIQFLDPANITQGYRPVQGLYMYVLYHLFGFNPDGYHWAHNFLHAANAVLVFFIVAKLGRTLGRTIVRPYRVAFIAALIYAVLPNYSLAVFWHAVVDPLSGFFYLLTILLWTRYLDTRHARDYALAFCAFVFALFSKEIAIFLPLFLFLIEWWFYRVTPNLRALVPRYTPFLIAFIPYLWLVYQVQSRGEFVGQFGFRIGPHMLNNLIPYAAVLTFPWFTALPTDTLAYVWLALVAIVYIGVMIYKRSTLLLFLALFAILNISPLLGFPLDYFHPRYLYLSTISSAVLLALIFEKFWELTRARRWLRRATIATLTLLVVTSSAQVADAAAGLAEYTRQIRVPFRDITRQRPTFAPNSYVYFVYSPLTSFWDFEGLFFARYGAKVKVNATDLGAPANLRHYEHAYVYYFDSTGKPIEIPVDKDAVTSATLALPARFQVPIVLEQYEVPSTRLVRGKALVAILNWRAMERIGKDYTVFAHLVDAQGNLIAEYNAQPVNGKSPTSQWPLHRTVVDAVVLSIADNAPLGDRYRLEIGMYDVDTLERLFFVDDQGRPVADKIVIGSFSIVER